MVSGRVDGHFHGERIRQNFKTRDEAVAEKEILDLKAGQNKSALCAIVPSLSEEQVREAEVHYRQLPVGGPSLSLCVDFALANRRDPAKQ